MSEKSFGSEQRCINEKDNAEHYLDPKNKSSSVASDEFLSWGDRVGIKEGEFSPEQWFEDSQPQPY
jgi:hypothetical protein